MTAYLRLNRTHRDRSGRYAVQLCVSYSGKAHCLTLTRMTPETFNAATRSRNVDKAWSSRFAEWERRANLILSGMEVFSWERFKEEWHGKRGQGEYLKHYFDHAGSPSTRRVYSAALKSFSAAWGNVRVVDVTPEKVRQWAASSGLSPNSVTSYMRCLKAALNEAHRSGYLKTVPEIAVEATRPRAGYLTAEEMKAIRDYRTLDAEEAEARDLFVLSYLCFAANFADLLSWTGANVQGDAITYRRTKTGKPVSIPITTEINEIIETYGDLHTGRGYLLKYYRTARTDQDRDRIKNRVLTRTRERVRKIAEKLGFEDVDRFRPSILRQTVLNALVSQGVDPQVVTWLMGTSVQNAGRHYFEAGAVVDISKKLAL